MTQLSATTPPAATGPRISGAAALLSRPRMIALGCIGVLTAAGWTYLLIVTLQSGSVGSSALFDAICRVTPPGLDLSAEGAAVIAAMWVAMTLAMMLPTAGPMILTYAEIAETAARKGERIVPPHVLIGGYLTVWLGFAALATCAQLAVMWGAAWPWAAGLAGPASALLFLNAGLYQFSALKQVCLAACQSPFSFFFLNWTDRPFGVFRLGVRQGMYCLGCCWAMMLLMFVAGAMNAVWMAALGLVMVIEKMTASSYVSRIAGIAFIAAGLAILAAWALNLVS